jgi:hypothetical protein
MSSPSGRPGALAVGWFPRSEWREALERWPNLAEEMPPDFDGYRQEVEARTKRINRNLHGQTLQLAALTVSGLEAFAEARNADAGTGETRGAYAAWQLQRGEGVPWPPHRNEMCWCGSGLKYKRCCGPVPASSPAEEHGSESG